MKTTKEKIEVMQAYLEGKEIEWKFTKVRSWEPAITPRWDWGKVDYRIKQNWWDNIPDGGVLCWVWDCEDDKKSVMGIVGYDSNCSLPFFTIDNMSWEHATPLTQQEIQAFLNKAKDIGV